MGTWKQEVGIWAALAHRWTPLKTEDFHLEQVSFDLRAARLKRGHARDVVHERRRDRVGTIYTVTSVTGLGEQGHLSRPVMRRLAQTEGREEKGGASSEEQRRGSRRGEF